MTKKKLITINIYAGYYRIAQQRCMKLAQLVDECCRIELRAAQTQTSRNGKRPYYALQGCTRRMGHEVKRTTLRIPQEVWEYCELNTIKKSVFLNTALKNWAIKGATLGKKGYEPICNHCYYCKDMQQCELTHESIASVRDGCANYTEVRL